MTTDDFTTISLPHDARGEVALQYVEDPRRSDAQAPQLWLRATETQKADAYTGAALKARLTSHLARSNDASVSLWPPDAEVPKALITDLIGPLPDRCTVPVDMSAPRRSGDVLVPGLVIKTLEEAENAALFLQMTAHIVGVERAGANLLAQGLIALAHNGLTYASTSSCKTVVCASVDRETSQATVVALDQGQTVCASGQESELLCGAMAAAETRFGGLANLRHLANQVEIPATMTLSSGGARVTRPGSLRAVGAYVPGWCAALTVPIRGRG